MPEAAVAFLCACFCPQGGEGQSLSPKANWGKSALGLLCVMRTFRCIAETFPPSAENLTFPSRDERISIGRVKGEETDCQV